MPQVTVYIRAGDIEKWKALQKKSEFIHNALNPLVLKHKDYSKSDKFRDLRKDHDIRYEPPEPIA